MVKFLYFLVLALFFITAKATDLTTRTYYPVIETVDELTQDGTKFIFAGYCEDDETWYYGYYYGSNSCLRFRSDKKPLPFYIESTYSNLGGAYKINSSNGYMLATDKKNNYGEYVIIGTLTQFSEGHYPAFNITFENTGRAIIRQPKYSAYSSKQLWLGKNKETDTYYEFFYVDGEPDAAKLPVYVCHAEPVNELDVTLQVSIDGSSVSIDPIDGCTIMYQFIPVDDGSDAQSPRRVRAAADDVWTEWNAANWAATIENYTGTAKLRLKAVAGEYSSPVQEYVLTLSDTTNTTLIPVTKVDAEYYDLQGRPVDINASDSGIYVRKVGSVSTKIIKVQ